MLEGKLSWSVQGVTGKPEWLLPSEQGDRVKGMRLGR